MTRHTFSFTFQARDAESPSRLNGGSPLRILVLGDFAPRTETAGTAPSLAPSAIRRIDIDNFDEVMSALEPSVTIAAEDRNQLAEPLVFRCLDDFHPDRLAQQDPVLRRLRGLKEQLGDPAAFSIAAAALAYGSATAPEDAAGKGVGAKDSGGRGATAETDAETLERLLGARPTSPTARASTQGGFVEALIRRLAAAQPTGATPELAPYIAAADAAASDRLRRVLQDPGFQALEASWRSLYALVSQVETGEDLQIALLSLGDAAFRRALGEVEEAPKGSALYRLLSDAPLTGPEAGTWNILVGDYAFGPGAEDIRCLDRIGALCTRLGARFFAAARPELFGCPDLVTHPHPRDWDELPPEALRRWQALRSGPAAQGIALALPRVLLRLPYGKSSDPCDAFTFEEMPLPPRHEAFLWGNPAFYCVLALVRAQPRDEAPPGYADVDDLPAYVYRDGDDMRMQACAEVYLSEAAAEAIQQRGCIPVLSHPRRNAVRLGPLQTLAISMTSLH